MVSKPKFRLRFGVPSCWVGLTLSLSLTLSSLFLSPLSSLLLFAYYSIFFFLPRYKCHFCSLSSLLFLYCFSLSLCLSVSLSGFLHCKPSFTFQLAQVPFSPPFTHTHIHIPTPTNYLTHLCFFYPSKNPTPFHSIYL